MHKTESNLENETRKIIWDFEIQTGHLFPAKTPAFVIINEKENLPYRGLCHHGEPQSENQRKR